MNLRFLYIKWKLWISIILIPAIALSVAIYVSLSSEGSYMVAGVSGGVAFLWILLVIEVGVSHWMQSYSGIEDAEMSSIRSVVEYALAFCLFLNLAYHAFYARGIAERENGMKELYVEQDRSQAMRDREFHRLKEISIVEADRLRAERDKLSAEAKKENSEAWKLTQLRRAGGRVYGGLAVKPTPPIPTDIATSVPQSPAMPSATTMPPLESVADFRRRHSFWLFMFGIVGTGFAVLGGSYFLTKLHLDTDANGLPDWMDRAVGSGKASVESLRNRYAGKFNFPADDDATASASLPQSRIVGFAPKSLENDSGDAFVPIECLVSPYGATSGDTLERGKATPVRRHSGVASEGDLPRREGNHWIVIGYSMPDIPRIRWKGNRRKSRIEARELSGDGYLCCFGKKRLDEMSAFPDEKRFKTIASIVRDAILKKEKKNNG